MAGAGVMDKKLCLALVVLTFGPILTLASQRQALTYGAIVVRGDIYADWTLATAYSAKEQIPVLTLVEKQNEEAILGILSALKGSSSQVLIVGDSDAISVGFENSLEGMGVSVDRVGGATRESTSIQMIVRGLWAAAEAAIVVDGGRSDLYVLALNVSRGTLSPIVFSKEGLLPEDFTEAADRYLTDLKKVYLIGDSLVDEEIEDLEGRGLSVVPSASDQNNVVHRKTWLALVRWLRTDLLSVPTLIGMLLGFSMTYLYLIRRPERGGVMNFLSADEKRLMGAIIDRGEVKQQELPPIIGYSRAKISRLISELVDRHMLERERMGKTYVLRATDSFKKAAGK